jgi:hypothetical protein
MQIVMCLFCYDMFIYDLTDITPKIHTLTMHVTAKLKTISQQHNL